LYAPTGLVDLFEAALHDEEVFRDNVKVFAQEPINEEARLTPSRIAPLVRQSLPDLKPTSANKMFNAFIRSNAAAPKVVEFNSIHDVLHRSALAEYYTYVGIPLIECLRPEADKMSFLLVEGQRSFKYQVSAGVKEFYAGVMPADKFVDLLDTMRWYEGANYKQNIVNPHIKYLRDLMGGGGPPRGVRWASGKGAVLLPLQGRVRQRDGIPGSGFRVLEADLRRVW